MRVFDLMSSGVILRVEHVMAVLERCGWDGAGAKVGGGSRLRALGRFDAGTRDLGSKLNQAAKTQHLHRSIPGSVWSFLGKSTSLASLCQSNVFAPSFSLTTTDGGLLGAFVVPQHTQEGPKVGYNLSYGSAGSESLPRNGRQVQSRGNKLLSMSLPCFRSQLPPTLPRSTKKCHVAFSILGCISVETSLILILAKESFDSLFPIVNVTSVTFVEITT